ncbi:MAG TPA: isoprenylcysteine carboxylmethyltransferase family protein [Xanthomonadaceae bacterium]|jgi:protein-S-isoprenylcysteine O-methyltransferase|nr:isoprenylcysteine carboxylmethyltransferase family protein [Xanthomonadaceae bacterium]
MTDLRNIAIAAFFLWMFVDSLFVFRHTTGAAENRDRFSLGLIMIGSMLALWISIGLAFGTFGATHSAALQIAGLVVLTIGIVVRSTAIAQLGRFHTPNVAVRTDHRLLQTGLYRLVRHPSYLGALLAYLGFSLALGNWLSMAVIMGVTPCLYLYRIHEEDAALLAAFGDTYRTYCARTRRLIPWLY